MLTGNSLRNWIALRTAPDITRARFYAVIQKFGSPERVFRASARELASIRGFDEALARSVLEAPRSPGIEEELHLIEHHDVSVYCADCAEYPANLHLTSFPPPLLFVRGTLHPDDRYAVGIVGSRHATQYGKAVADQMASRLASCGVTVVSGFARGIDSHAHAAAIKWGGRTLAVLGNGLANCYPAENRALAERICSHGALVSEYPMRTPPDRFNFPERNRVIAALSLGTVVVEAAEKSGALITAREALDENRFLFAVPGDVTRLNSRGANLLIQNGARLVQSADDILMEMKDQLRGYLRDDQQNALQTEQVGKGNEQSTDVTSRQPVPPSARPTNKFAGNLTDEERYIYELLRHEPVVFDLLVSQIEPGRMSVQKLSAVLLSLELKQAIRQLPGRFYAVLE